MKKIHDEEAAIIEIEDDACRHFVCVCFYNFVRVKLDIFLHALNTTVPPSTDLHLRQLPEHRLLLPEGREGASSEPAD